MDGAGSMRKCKKGGVMMAGLKPWFVLYAITPLRLCFLAWTFIVVSNAQSADREREVVDCLGTHKHYRFIAEKWRADGDDPWKSMPFNMANVFDFDLLPEKKSQIEYVAIFLDKKSTALHVVFYSKSGVTIFESQESVEVQQCMKDRTILKTKGSRSGDGGRVRIQKDIQIVPWLEGVRIETKVKSTSSFLFFRDEWNRSYSAEFNNY